MSEFQGTLHNDLKKFGLNPSEWIIEHVTDEIYQIAHIDDHQFCFLGEAQYVGLLAEWAQIKLWSF